MPDSRPRNPAQAEPTVRFLRPLWLALLTVLATGGAVVAGPSIDRGFDGPQTSWTLLNADLPAQIVDQRCVNDDFRAGAGSERIVLMAPPGESARLACATERLPVLDELQVRLWIKANTPGVLLAVRVVLPRSLDRETQKPLTAILSRPAYQQAGHWQQLVLTDVPRLLGDEVRVMRAVPGASIDAREAFVDAVVLLVPGGGPRQTVVWTDALEVDGIVLGRGAGGPALAAAGASRPDDAQGSGAGWRQQPLPSLNSDASASQPAVRLQGTSLLVDGKPFVPRAIQWNGEPLEFLAERGFNTLLLSQLPTPDQTDAARQHNLWLICVPPSPDDLDPRSLAESSDRVLAWYFGDPLADSERDFDFARRWVNLLRRHDPFPGRPILMTPQADWPELSQLADVLVAGHARASTIAAADFAAWLEGRPLLSRPGMPLWAQLPTQPGQLVQRQAESLAPRIAESERDPQSLLVHAEPGSSVPLNVDAARLESLVRVACTRGCRGFLFQSGSRLDANNGPTRRRAMLLELVNRQLQLAEAWLASGKVVGRVASSDMAEAAVVFQVDQARLLIPLDSMASADGSPQQVDTLTAAPKSLVIPGVPESNQAFLLSPAGQRPLARSRVAGGILVVVDREDDPLVLMTEDARVIAAFRRGTTRVGPAVARLHRDLAMAQGEQIVTTGRRLESVQIVDAEAGRAIASAGAMMQNCDRQLAAGDVDRAYQSAGAARRLLAMAATRQKQSLDVPNVRASFPLTISDDTLAEQAEFLKSSAAFGAGENELYGGDFEDVSELMQLGWQHVAHLVPGITAGAELSAEGPKSGRYCLRLSAATTKPDDGPVVVPAPPASITSPPLPVAAGEIIEISGWVRVSEPIAGSIDGLQIVDSLGGPELALSVDETGDWQPFRMIRAVPESTAVTVTFALAGMGTASVDAVMIRSLSGAATRRLPPTPAGAEVRGPNMAVRQPLLTSP